MPASHRTTYQLPAESHDTLRELADRADVSMAEVVRRGAEYALEAGEWPEDSDDWNALERPFAVHLPPELDKRIDEAATEADLSRPEALRWATHLALDLQGPPSTESAETRLSDDPA